MVAGLENMKEIFTVCLNEYIHNHIPSSNNRMKKAELRQYVSGENLEMMKDIKVMI